MSSPGSRFLASLGILALLGCGADPAPPRGVVARVGGFPAADVRPPIETLQLKGAKGTLLQSRNFEVQVPDAADRVEWSVSAPDGKARFLVELREGSGDWTPIDDRTLSPSSGWLDLVRPLPPGRNRVLRFDATTDDSPLEPLWASIVLAGELTEPARPNVLLISLDTLGADHLGSFQGPKDVSPNLDAFLESAASFRRAYAQYGNTLVSHSSLFSALYPLHHRVKGGQAPRPLNASLVRAVGDAGYRTAAFTEGGFVSGAYGFGVGFDRYEEGNPHESNKMTGWADQTFDAAAEWLEALAPNEQYFLFVHTYEVHSPYLPRDDEALAFANRLTPHDDRTFTVYQQRKKIMSMMRTGKLDSSVIERLEALHQAEIRSLDSLFAAFLERIEPITRSTLVVVFADHGDQFGEWDRLGHGDSLHDRVIHVPMAFRGPGVHPRSFDSPTQLVDVMPTVLDYLDLPVPQPIDGRSLAGVLRDPKARLEPRPAFAEQGTTHYPCESSPKRTTCSIDRVAVIEERFKLVDTRDPDSAKLYDLRNDPLETRDVAPQHPADVERLAGLALAYRRAGPQTPAPAPTGEAPVPDAETLRQLRALGYETGEPEPPPAP